MATGDPMRLCPLCKQSVYEWGWHNCIPPFGTYHATTPEDKLATANFYTLSEPAPKTFELAPKPMNNLSKPEVEVGIIVGRFQCPFLHDGHLEILKHVVNSHPRVFVFLGQSPLKCTQHDPLDFNTRRAMIEQAFPEIEVHRIDDMGNNERWTRELDRQIGLLIGPTQTVVLYGSRDSFIPAYSGRFKTTALTPSRHVSASEIRKAIGVRSKKTREFREGVVWAVQNQYPKIYATVDIATLDISKNSVLLVRKPHEEKFRFPGGFSDIISKSYEEDALRELVEETEIIGKAIDYIGSTLIDDWRYRPQIDKIKTMFFAVTEWGGNPLPSDDLKGGEVKWFRLNEPIIDKVVDTHKPLVTMLLNWKYKIDSIVSEAKKSVLTENKV
jgi:bifunctional NMN adenylyltransferase/nudix hydrolase